MRYENCAEAKDACVSAQAPVDSLSNILHDTRSIASDVRNMVDRINGHLFGLGNPCCEKEADPKCFRDELEKTRRELLETAEELSKMCCLLGI